MPVPADIKADQAQYQNARSASFHGFLGSRGILITTHFANTPQVANTYEQGA